MYSVQYLHFSILLFTFNLTANVLTQPICGDWHQLYDLKCIKIISEDHLYNFDYSEQVCSQLQINSVLLTIESAKEQEFISEFLFKTNTIVDNVWIGLRRNTSNDAFEWRDASDLHYINWINGSPSNETDYNCVQLTAESGQTGKWVNIQCNKKNLVVCQKPANYLISYLQKIIFETKEQLINTQNYLNQTREQLTEQIKQTKGELNAKITNTSEELNKTRVKFNVLLDNLFNKWIHYKLFTDSDGNRKAFFIPMNENYVRKTFDEAVNTCNKYNATLVEPKTAQKQHIFQTFLGQFGLEGYIIERFWINAKRDSSRKFRWLSTGEEFTFTNWYPNYPIDPPSGLDYVYFLVFDVHPTQKGYYGKWANYHTQISLYVVCEQQIYI